MNKSYPTSRLHRVFSLGLDRMALRVDDGDMLWLGPFKRVDIRDIEGISYEVIPAGYSWSYVYRFALRGGRHIDVSYSRMEGRTWKEFLEDVQTVNPQIKVEYGIAENLVKSEERPPLRFDFTPPAKGTRLMKDAQFQQRHPSLDAAIGFSIIGAYIVFPLLLYLSGTYVFTSLRGAGYAEYRNFMAVLCGFSLATVAMNLIASLASQYLGHKVTVIAGALAVVFLAIAII